MGWRRHYYAGENITTNDWSIVLVLEGQISHFHLLLTCEVCTFRILLLDYIKWSPYVLTLISPFVYSGCIAPTLPTLLHWFLFSDIFLYAYISPQISLCCSSILYSVCGTGFGWSLLSSLSNSLSILIFALTGPLCSDKFPPLGVTAELAIPYNSMQTTRHLIQCSLSHFPFNGHFLTFSEQCM